MLGSHSSPDRLLTPGQRAVVEAAGPRLTAQGLLLVGGTALGFHLGHRRSRDLDWFGPVPATRDLLRWFSGAMVERDETVPARHVILRLPATKVELVGASIRREGAVEILPGVCIPALEECAALKMAAAVNRGRRRDLVDVAFLLRSGLTARRLCELVEARFPGRITRGALLKQLLSFRQRPLFDGTSPVDLLDPLDPEILIAEVERAFAALFP